VYREAGATDDHHTVSHHQSVPHTLEVLEKIDIMESEMVARFLQRLQDEPSASGGTSLLDDSVILHGSGIADGDLHNFDNLPTVVFGRAGGAIAGARHRDATGQPISALHLSLAAAAGHTYASHGDATQGLEGLAG